MTIGEKIKAARGARKMTQEELAIEAGMKRSSVCDLERDRYNPSHSTLSKLASALNLKVEYFFTSVGIETTDPIPALDLTLTPERAAILVCLQFIDDLSKKVSFLQKELSAIKASQGLEESAPQIDGQVGDGSLAEELIKTTMQVLKNSPDRH
jgi:transcriptional regulator with XRE-family HTH domain